MAKGKKKSKGKMRKGTTKIVRFTQERRIKRYKDGTVRIVSFVRSRNRKKK